MAAAPVTTALHQPGFLQAREARRSVIHTDQARHSLSRTDTRALRAAAGGRIRLGGRQYVARYDQQREHLSLALLSGLVLYGDGGATGAV